MKKIILVFVTIILVTSCNSEKKKKAEEVEVIENEEKKNYEQVLNEIDGMDFIFNDGFTFTEGVTVDQIGILKSGEETYKVIYFLNDDSNFEKIEGLNVAFRVYPKSPELFLNKKDQEAKAKTFAANSNIYIMDNSKVVISNEFTIVPKEMKSVKVYFYDPKGGVEGETMTILNTKFY